MEYSATRGSTAIRTALVLLGSLVPGCQEDRCPDQVRGLLDDTPPYALCTDDTLEIIPSRGTLTLSALPTSAKDAGAAPHTGNTDAAPDGGALASGTATERLLMVVRARSASSEPRSRIAVDVVVGSSTDAAAVALEPEDATCETVADGALKCQLDADGDALFAVVPKTRSSADARIHATASTADGTTQTRIAEVNVEGEVKRFDAVSFAGTSKTLPVDDSDKPRCRMDPVNDSCTGTRAMPIVLSLTRNGVPIAPGGKVVGRVAITENDAGASLSVDPNCAGAAHDVPVEFGAESHGSPAFLCSDRRGGKLTLSASAQFETETREESLEVTVAAQPSILVVRETGATPADGGPVTAYSASVEVRDCTNELLAASVDLAGDATFVPDAHLNVSTGKAAFEVFPDAPGTAVVVFASVSSITKDVPHCPFVLGGGSQ